MPGPRQRPARPLAGITEAVAAQQRATHRCLNAKLQARPAKASRHEVEDRGRADAGTQAASDGPARDPRPWRPPVGPPAWSSSSGQDASHDAKCRLSTKLGKWMPRPRLGDAAPARPSSPARNASPLAGKRVIDNGNTSGHVPQHARQLCQGPGDGGRRRVPRRPEIGSHAGRKSGHQ
ncbi:hypothetical protein SADUNF_Sadunf07G0064000 [Salix dunnii]|uniref:Uncharacterized protein n=1 Tax=Salix dunnii TaxID=1413687 RepID=A0A835MTW6_9ROSI|nr:hypothetical protein SADUNF_Sadunf07G0064000 [Salix dunnii]